MMAMMKISVILLLVPAAIYAVPRFNRYTYENPNILTPPQDPAINTFPKDPVVPLIPMCVHSGYFRDPFNCGKYYHCEHSEANPKAFYCQDGFIFNELTDLCDDPQYVAC